MKPPNAADEGMERMMKKTILSTLVALGFTFSAFAASDADCCSTDFREAARKAAEMTDQQLRSGVSIGKDPYGFRAAAKKASALTDLQFCVLKNPGFKIEGCEKSLEAAFAADLSGSEIASNLVSSIRNRIERDRFKLIANGTYESTAREFEAFRKWAADEFPELRD